jgi:hypothetical protein
MFAFLTCLAVASATTVPPSTTTAPLPPKCERAPAHAQPADAFYRLGIAGDPDLFLPGELYTSMFFNLLNCIARTLLNCSIF